MYRKNIRKEGFTASSDFSTLDPRVWNVVIFYIERIRKGGTSPS
jgi:hypothetical protein